MGGDEDGTLARMKAHRGALIDPAIRERRGRIVKTTGDGLLVDFGEQTVKNIARPVRVFGMSAAGVAALPAAAKQAPAASLALPDRPSIAILPFVNLSGDPEQSYFADGITEDIITELSRFRSL